MTRGGFFAVDSLRGVHVLVVDDEADCRDLLTAILGYCGALVTTAGSTGEALHVMELIKPDVSTICVGMAASMGAVLLIGGAKGKRYALPNSTVMLHQAAGGFEGTAADIEIQAKEILRLQNRIREIIVYHTGQPMERVARDSDRDFFLTPEQAKEYGIVDEIIGHPSDVTKLDGKAK